MMNPIEKQSLSFIRPMPVGDYYVRVILNGVPVPTENHCNDANGRGSDCSFSVIVSFITNWFVSQHTCVKIKH